MMVSLQLLVDAPLQEPEKSWKLNVDTTKHLATLTNKFGARLIYISTDYVFAGTLHAKYLFVKYGVLDFDLLLIALNF